MTRNQQIQNFQDALETAEVDSFAGARGVLIEGIGVGDSAVGGDVLAELDTGGASNVSVNIDVTNGPISVRYDTSPDGGVYFENVRTIDATPDGDLQDITALRDELVTGARYVRVVLTSPASGTATATIAVEASG